MSCLALVGLGRAIGIPPAQALYEVYVVRSRLTAPSLLSPSPRRTLKRSPRCRHSPGRTSRSFVSSPISWTARNDHAVVGLGRNHPSRGDGFRRDRQASPVMTVGLVAGLVLIAKAAAIAAELIVTLDRQKTPQAAFNGLIDAHAALIRAKAALEAELDAGRQVTVEGK